MKGLPEEADREWVICEARGEEVKDRHRAVLRREFRIVFVLVSYICGLKILDVGINNSYAYSIRGPHASGGQVGSPFLYDIHGLGWPD